MMTLSSLRRGDRIRYGAGGTGVVAAVVGRTVWFHDSGGHYKSAPIEAVEKC